MATTSLPHLGFGLGLRTKHMPHILEHRPAVDWFEVISENYMDTGGKQRRNLARIAEHYPIVLHGVSLSIGTVDALNSEYLRKLKSLINDVKPAWVSDHLCWTGVAHKNTHDLLPVPYTEEALKHIVQRIREVQDFLERPIALENPSTYLEFKSSTMSEAEFITRMAEDSGCNLLLDVNNVYVTCYNHRLDAKAYLDALPLERVVQMHLSGHTNKGTHIIDTHDDHVIDDVWNLYKYVVQKAGRTPNTMIEWDDKIPEFPVLYAELEKARAAANDAQHFTIPELAKPNTPYVMNENPALILQQETLQEAIMKGQSMDSRPAEWIRQKEDFSAEQQLGVYINAYRWRLFDVVAEDYAVLKTYLGKTKFDALIDGFIRDVPPQHFNVARYAARLPEYQQADPNYDAFAQELCVLETAITQLADEEEVRALTPEDLTGMTPDSLMKSRLFPRKALKLFAFNYDVNGYYRAVIDKTPAATPQQTPSWLAVFRHEDVMWRMDLEEQEYLLLSALFNGATVGEALENCAESFAANISEYFSRWMRNGLLAAAEYKIVTNKGTTYEAA
ncbi:MAG: DUF692 family protein [Alphaproteobacteria bacterium]|nr:DUF692 family protein [Alphaproteobacteria bacterium]